MLLPLFRTLTKLSGPLDHQMDNDSNGKKMKDGSNNHDSDSLIPALGNDLSIQCLIHLSRKDYPFVASMNRSFRYVIQSGKIFKLRRQMGIKEHWVYLSCQHLQWLTFDPSSLKWFTLPRMVTDPCFKFAEKESLAVSTQLLVFGREIESNVVYKYSLLTNSWSIGAKPISPRCLFASASVGDIGIIAGGCSPKGDVLSSAELYNSETGSWETLPSMNTPRKSCSGVIMDGKYFYVIGGIGVDESTLLESAEVFDIEKRTWHEIPNMYTLHSGEISRERSKATPLFAVVKNELYGAFYEEYEVRKYDKKNNVWVPMGKLPDKWTCPSMNRWGITFKACGDVIVVLGGPRSSVGGILEINAWEPSDNGATLQWTVLGTKVCGTFVYNCAVMGC